MHPKVTDLCARGYCVLESVYGENERRQIRRILTDAWQRASEPPMGGRFGFVMHPLLKYAPEMAPYYLKNEILDLLALVLQDEVRLAHSGALLCDETRDFCDWHYHLNTEHRSEEVMWDLQRLDHLGHFDRVLCNVYLDGSNDDVGPLVVSPRRLTDPWAPASLQRQGDWPGQEVVYCPPGSAIVFDTGLFHSARRPQKPGRRFLWGGHYQGHHNTVPHREDNRYDGPEMSDYQKRYPLFRG